MRTHAARATIPSQLGDSRISAVAAYLKDISIADLPTVALIAAKVNISESYLRHKFRECTGMSLGEYVRRLRFEKARILLRKGPATVKQAMIEVGIVDHSLFARRYKAYFGETPSETKRACGIEKWRAVLESPPISNPVHTKKLA